MNVIEYLNKTEGYELTAADFALLKPGHDQWSRIRWPTLGAYLDLETCCKVAKCRNPGAVARFILRGLTLEKAILKVAYDLERESQFHAQGHEEKRIREEVIG